MKKGKITLITAVALCVFLFSSNAFAKQKGFKQTYKGSPFINHFNNYNKGNAFWFNWNGFHGWNKWYYGNGMFNWFNYYPYNNQKNTLPDVLKKLVDSGILTNSQKSKIEKALEEEKRSSVEDILEILVDDDVITIAQKNLIISTWNNQQYNLPYGQAKKTNSKHYLNPFSSLIKYGVITPEHEKAICEAIMEASKNAKDKDKVSIEKILDSMVKANILTVYQKNSVLEKLLAMENDMLISDVEAYLNTYFKSRRDNYLKDDIGVSITLSGNKTGLSYKIYLDFDDADDFEKLTDFDTNTSKKRIEDLMAAVEDKIRDEIEDTDYENAKITGRAEDADNKNYYVTYDGKTYKYSW
ncbi:hypothetical protein OXPF_03050 [Oxobacter pfennigii]|uniref:Uncharacterized protein n=1 Tax=Oxobacter pfennigii TaxID=36849 RepID=A0A0P9ALE7_9CLOT|nr:hypothetical protein [Oxobacter pfennigii]KPU46195.1 hypothetical protein OXPF_03050 [Oxobacter pfennigii]